MFKFRELTERPFREEKDSTPRRRGKPNEGGIGANLPERSPRTGASRAYDDDMRAEAKMASEHELRKSVETQRSMERSLDDAGNRSSASAGLQRSEEISDIDKRILALRSYLNNARSGILADV